MLLLMMEGFLLLLLLLLLLLFQWSHYYPPTRIPVMHRVIVDEKATPVVVDFGMLKTLPPLLLLLVTS